MRVDAQTPPSPPPERPPERPLERLQHAHHHRVHHLLVESWIALGDVQTAVEHHGGIVQVDRLVPAFVHRVVVDDLDQPTRRSGLNLFVRNISDHRAPRTIHHRVERDDAQRPPPCPAVRRRISVRPQSILGRHGAAHGVDQRRRKSFLPRGQIGGGPVRWALRCLAAHQILDRTVGVADQRHAVFGFRSAVLRQGNRHAGNEIAGAVALCGTMHTDELHRLPGGEAQLLAVRFYPLFDIGSPHFLQQPVLLFDRSARVFDP
jgi:hypothetical protein